MRGETFRAPQAKKIAPAAAPNAQKCDYYMLIPKNFRLRRAEFRIHTCDYHVPKLKWNVIIVIFIQFFSTPDRARCRPHEVTILHQFLVLESHLQNSAGTLHVSNPLLSGRIFSDCHV